MMLNLGIVGSVIGVKGGEDAENVNASVQVRGKRARKDGAWMGNGSEIAAAIAV